MVILSAATLVLAGCGDSSRYQAGDIAPDSEPPRTSESLSEVETDSDGTATNVPAVSTIPVDPNPSTPNGPITTMEDFINEQSIDKSAPNWKTKLPKPPKLTFDPTKRYYWNLKTNKGSIRIRLMPDVAPMHASSTIYLTKLGFYDGLSFHRVIRGFMAQGGCPLGTGTGSPGYNYDGEFDRSVRHDRPGLLSMANAGAGTDGSQFFITFVATPHLDDKHTIFGEVDADDMETVRELEKHGTESGQTTTPLAIEEATIAVE